MNYNEIKRSPAWNQLTIDEKRFLRNHMADHDPKKALQVRIILERANKKAEAQARVQGTATPPPDPDAAGAQEQNTG